MTTIDIRRALTQKAMSKGRIQFIVSIELSSVVVSYIRGANESIEGHAVFNLEACEDIYMSKMTYPGEGVHTSSSTACLANRMRR